MKKMILLLITMCVISSCGSSSNKKKDFEGFLEQETGDEYEVQKGDTKQPGYVVYYNKTKNEYEAYNIDKWSKEEHLTFKDYVASGAVQGVDIVKNLAEKKEWIVSGYWHDVYETVTEYYDVYDEECDCYYEEYETYEVLVDSYYVDTSGYINFYYGGGFRFSNTTNSFKDLELLASLDEKISIGIISHKLKTDYKLSSSRSLEMAKLVNKYRKMEHQRELTYQEKNDFASKALGINFNQLEVALKENHSGDSNRLESLIKQAAKTNDTSAENIKQFMNDFTN